MGGHWSSPLRTEYHVTMGLKEGGALELPLRTGRHVTGPGSERAILHEAGRRLWTMSSPVLPLEPDFLQRGCAVGPDAKALCWEGLSSVVSDGEGAVGTRP